MFSRRSFLNLLGVVAVTTAAPPPVALFGSDDVDSNIIIPDRELVRSHFVVKAKSCFERVPKQQESGVIGRLAQRTPKRPILTRDGHFVIPPPISFDDRTSVQDAHAAYYIASHRMREMFTAFSLETLSQIDSTLRPAASLLTIAHSPIYPSPLQDSERGFELVADFEQFVVIGGDEAASYEQYSQFGEYPIDVPRDIDMGMLIRMDREVIDQRVTHSRGVLDLFRQRLKLT